MANQFPSSSTSINSNGEKIVTTFSYGSPVVAKTAAYTVLPSDSGTVFTTRGAGVTVAFTLPAVAQSGLQYTFIAVAAQSMTVASVATIKGAPSFTGTTITVAGATGSVQYTRVTVLADGTVWLITDIQGTATVG